MYQSNCGYTVYWFYTVMRSIFRRKLKSYVKLGPLYKKLIKLTLWLVAGVSNGVACIIMQIS